jgi:hypothetical protein
MNLMLTKRVIILILSMSFLGQMQAVNFETINQICSSVINFGAFSILPNIMAIRFQQHGVLNGPAAFLAGNTIIGFSQWMCQQGKSALKPEDFIVLKGILAGQAMGLTYPLYQTYRYFTKSSEDKS